MEKEIQLRDPGQQDISGFFRRTFTQTTSSFGRIEESVVSEIPPMTSTQAKLRAKQKEMGMPRMSEAEMRAILKAEEAERKKREDMEKKLLRQRDLKARKKIQAREKTMLKKKQEKGKQPEGQESLTKYGFIQKVSKSQLSEGGQCNKET